MENEFNDGCTMRYQVYFHGLSRTGRNRDRDVDARPVALMMMMVGTAALPPPFSADSKLVNSWLLALLLLLLSCCCIRKDRPGPTKKTVIFFPFFLSISLHQPSFFFKIHLQNRKRPPSEIWPPPLNRSTKVWISNSKNLVFFLYDQLMSHNIYQMIKLSMNEQNQ